MTCELEQYWTSIIDKIQQLVNQIMINQELQQPIDQNVIFHSIKGA